MALPQTWDEVGQQWDAALSVWDPPPPGAVLTGALRGTGILEGVLVLGVVALEGGVRGTGVLAGQLSVGSIFQGALVGHGVFVGSDLQTGVLFIQNLRGTGVLSAAFFVPPAGALFGGDLRGTGTLTGFLPGVALLVPHLFGPDSPVSLTPHLDENFAALLAQINHPQALGIGPLAGRPAPGHQGAIYVATDRNDEWWMDDGLTWRSMGALGSGMVVHDQATDTLLLLGAPPGPPGATHVLTAAKATVVPTQAIIDGAVLYVADVQGDPGRAAWHHLSEAGTRTPLDPVVFRQGFQTFSNTATQFDLMLRLLKGGTLPGRYLEVWWRGDVSNNVAGRTLFLILWYGASLAQITLTAIPVGSFMPLSVLFRIDGLTGAVQLGQVVSLIAPSPATITVQNTTTDATVDQWLDLAASLSVADPAFQLRTLAATVTLR